MKVQAIILSIFLISCSKVDKRVELLERTLDIDLSENYQMLNDSYVSKNQLLERDFTIILGIKLEQQELDSIVRVIEGRPYFDELGRFKNNSGGYTLIGSEASMDFNNIVDSLSRTKFRGSWFKTSNGYEFADVNMKFKDLTKEQNIVHAKINLIERSITFEYTSI